MMTPLTVGPRTAYAGERGTRGRHILSIAIRLLWVAAALVVAAVLLQARDAHAQSMANYTAVPPFVSESVPPNVLVLLGNSASLDTLAHAATFAATVTYPGLFDPAECYVYTGVGSLARFTPDTAANPASMPAGGWTCAGNPTYEWSGNLLNYATMRRIDLAKKALVGGICIVAGPDGCLRVSGQYSFQSANTTCCANQSTFVSATDAGGRMPPSLIPAGGTVHFHMVGTSASLRGGFCIDDDSDRPADTAINCGDPDTTYVEIGFLLRADLATPSDGGIIQQMGEKVRFGLMTLNAQEGGQVVEGVGAGTADMVAAVEQAVATQDNPLGEALFEASRYFAQIPPYLTETQYPQGASNDPYYDPFTGQLVTCCRSFILVFTDGAISDDASIPMSLNNLAPSAEGADDSQIVDDAAYWAHITDLRQASLPVIAESGNDLDEFQDVTVYAIDVSGDPAAQAITKTVARFGGFNDQNGNDVPDVQGEWDQIDNATGATGADGLPDTYFNLTNVETVQDRLMVALATAVGDSASGTSPAARVSSTTGGGALYQSFFYPKIREGASEVRWTGYTQALFLDAFGNLREDTNKDAALTYEDDKIVTMRFDTASGKVVVDRFDDVDSNGLPDNALGTVSLREVDAIWEAGNRLAQTPAGSRNVLTWVDLDNDGVVDSGEQVDFTTANANTLAPYLRAQGTSAPYTAAAIINFVLGCDPSVCSDQGALRNRQLTVGGSAEVWKLGDVIHADPIVVGAPAQRYDLIYGDASYTAFFQQYKDRRHVAYVGANDGMVHAFNGGFYHRGDDPSSGTVAEHGYFTRTPTGNSGGAQLGDELWGFIPQELLPHLKWLAQPDYTHVYYVDLTPKVTDVRIFTPDADHPNGWGTILMGGFRLGGSCGNCQSGTGAPPMTVNADFNSDGDTSDSGDTRTFHSAYFVLDITNPETDPSLLWSFSSTDLGLTTTVPSMLRVSPSGADLTDNVNAKWFMLVGSGPTAYDGTIAQSGNFYAIDLATGPGTNNAQVEVLPAEPLNAFLGTPLTIDRDFDYRVDVAYAGSVIDDGSAPYRGKLYRLTMNTCPGAPCSPQAWGIPLGVDFRQPTELLDTFPQANTLQLGPIAAAPAVAVDDGNKLWVFAGTGRYYHVTDKAGTDQQYFLGVKDSVMNGTCAQGSRIDCHSNDLVDVSDAEVCLVGTGDCGDTTDQVTGVSGASNFPSLINLVASKDGWFTTLPATGERALERPQVIAGLVLFPTFVPVSDACASTGEGYLYALYYKTGSANLASVIGTTTSGINEHVNRATSLGQGPLSTPVVHIGASSGYRVLRIFCQNAQGQLCTPFRSQAPLPIASRFLTWLDNRG